MTLSSLSLGPTIRARDIRSGLSTKRTSELREDPVDRLLDVRLASGGHAGGLFASGGEHPLPLSRDRALGSGHDLPVTRLPLGPERIEEFEGLPPGVPQHSLAFLFGGRLRCADLGFRL